MTNSRPVARRLRIVGVTIAAGVVFLFVAVLLLLSFGWGLLRPLAERRASAALGKPVMIARIHRVGGGLLHPELAIEGVRVAQPRWAGQGDMVRIRSARVRIAALPLIAGRLDPQLTLVERLRAVLIRAKDGRANWEKAGPHRRGGSSPDLGQLVVRDAAVSIDDRQHRHRFALRIAIDRGGLRATGAGDVAGSPAHVTMQGPPLRGAAPWPFQAKVTASTVTLEADGTMRTPLDLGHFTARVRSWGRNLTDLDHLIGSGLPETQPYRLAAIIQHDGPAWTITRLGGTIGRSDLSGQITIRRHGDRALLDGSFTSVGFDFGDLANDAQLAKAAAEARRTGPRLFPSTRIRLETLRRTDGFVRIDIRRILSRTPTTFRSAKGTITLDHGVLTVPFTAGMAAGTLRGSFLVRHQSGTPLMIVDVRLTDSRAEKMIRTNGTVSGPLVGRMRVQGHGDTVREAMAHADGRVALVVRNAVITRRVALLMGADVGRGLFAGDADKTGLRCLIGAFAVKSGVARPDPVVIDTDVARADGTGTIAFSGERVAIDLRGRPKRDSPLRLNGPIEARGTIENTTLNPPPQTKSLGGILKMVGKALGGEQAPLATDADCGRLEAAALR